jgi:type II secretory pathway component PulJ
MKINHKLAAFTIMEVTVSMLIAAIAIAITYTAYSIINRSYSSYDQKNKKIAEFIMADKLLKQDFMLADKIIRTEQGIILESGQGVIQYEFTDSSILRDQYSLRVDTFQLKENQYVPLFENSEADIGERLDQLKLQTTWEGEMINLNYSKIYSAENLMNLSHRNAN